MSPTRSSVLAEYTCFVPTAHLVCCCAACIPSSTFAVSRPTTEDYYAHVRRWPIKSRISPWHGEPRVGFVKTNVRRARPSAEVSPTATNLPIRWEGELFVLCNAFSSRRTVPHNWIGVHESAAAARHWEVRYVLMRCAHRNRQAAWTTFEVGYVPFDMAPILLERWTFQDF